jgi:phage I-like protein
VSQSVFAICDTSPRVRHLERELNRRQGASIAALAHHTRHVPALGHGASGLTEEEVAVCRSMGISHDQFRASKSGAPSAALNSGRSAAGVAPGAGGYSASGLTEEDLAVCRSMGISQDQFLANKNGTPSAALSSAHSAAGGAPGAGGYNANSLSEADLAVCRSMGISQEDFLASKNGTPFTRLSAARPAASPAGHGITAAGLSSDEQSVCQQLGIAHAAFLSAKAH